MRIRKYTDQQVIDAVASSTSVRQVLSKLGLKEAGGNYHCIKLLIKSLGLDTSHFTSQGWSKGKYFGPKRPIEVYLSNEQTILSHSLKKRLIKEGYFDPLCCSCGLATWLDKPIILELHHINGNHLDNSLDNLQLLCPNCHSMTDNHRGKNKSKDPARMLI